MTTHEELELAFNQYQDHIRSFAQGNKAAGKRARKALLDLKKLAHTRRAEISDASKKK